MGAVPARPSMSRLSLFALTWHFSVWVGWALVVVSAVKVQPVMGEMPASFWVVAALVLLGELRPVRTAGVLGRPGDGDVDRVRVRDHVHVGPVAGAAAAGRGHRHLRAGQAQAAVEAVLQRRPVRAVGDRGVQSRWSSPACRTAWSRPAATLSGTDLLWIVPTWVDLVRRQQHAGVRRRRRRGPVVLAGVQRGHRLLRRHHRGGAGAVPADRARRDVQPVVRPAAAHPDVRGAQDRAHVAAWSSTRRCTTR